MMRHKDPEKMVSIVDFVNDFYDDNQRTPTIAEIAHALSLSGSTVHGYLTEMTDRGLIDYDGRMIVTEKIRKRISNYVRAGIVGRIHCGEISLDEEYIEDYIDLPMELFGGGELYVLHTYGDSMTGACIDDGDAVVIRRQSWANPGDLVVAYVEDRGNTLKRFLPDPKNHRIILHPENPKYDDIIVDTCQIQGVVRQIIKNT